MVKTNDKIVTLFPLTKQLGSRKNDKNTIDEVVKNYAEREIAGFGNDFVGSSIIFDALSKDYTDTMCFMKSVDIDEIEMISFVIKELICYYKSQELLDIFKKFVGMEFKYICTDSYDEDVEDAQYMLDNNIKIPTPNPN